MNISTAQKRRFLENIYKCFYSDGVKPTDQQIKKAFSDYFSINKPGFPIGIDYVGLQSSSVTSADMFNEIMINNLYNIDIYTIQFWKIMMNYLKLLLLLIKK